MSFDPDFASSPWQWADGYRSLGFSVVPCWDPKEGQAQWKRPKLSEWARWHNEPIPDVVHAQWYDMKTGEHRNRVNMGALTGAGAGRLVVIDLDIHKTPEAARWWHETVEDGGNGIEPETWMSLTGGGGQQLFFRWPEGRPAPTNRTPIGVDIRGQGGFVVLPPSIHNSGHEYAWAPGRAPWEIPLEDAPGWLVEAVEHLVWSYPGEQAQTGPQQRTASPESDFTPFGSRQDGREVEMYRQVWRAVLELFRLSPIQPHENQWQDQAMKAYEAYELKVISRIPGDKREGLEKEGRGPSAWWRKWRREMRRWGSPKMVAAAARPDPGGAKSNQYDPRDFDSAREQAQAASSDLTLLDVDQILAMAAPKYLIEGIMIEQSLGVMYGMPGALKTFVGLDVALSIATKQTTWWGYPIGRHGAVIYVSSEGLGDLQFRLMAWSQYRSTAVRNAPFRLAPDSLNFMDGADIGRLIARVQLEANKLNEPIAAVFVDTVSRVLPGADENLQKEMTLFVRGCDAIRKSFKTTVIGLHHTNKQGTLRGSSVIPGACDFLIQVRREPGQMSGSILVEKVKSANDGWDRPFVVKRIDLAMGHTSLVVDGADEEAAAAAGATLDAKGWPAREICREILAAIAEAWFKKQPWGAAHNHARPAIRIIARRWRLKRDVVKDMLETWIDNEVIVEETIDLHKRIKGYRKLTDI